jgi:hypothetical protein
VPFYGPGGLQRADAPDLHPSRAERPSIACRLRHWLADPSPGCFLTAPHLAYQPRRAAGQARVGLFVRTDRLEADSLGYSFGSDSIRTP